MKKIIPLVVLSLLFVSTIISCKEEDERDKFVGTWAGNLFFSRIGTEYPVTVTISKSKTNPAQIIIGQNTATVYGNN
jgi:serine protease inhibitor ecotin